MVGGLAELGDQLLALPDGPGLERNRLLVRAGELADSLAALAEEWGQASHMLAETRTTLIRMLASEAASLRESAERAIPQEKASLEARARAAEEEAEGLRTLAEAAGAGTRHEEARGARPGRIGPTSWPEDSEGRLPASARSSLMTLARVAAEEHARLSELEILQEDLRLFLGELRLFDETGLPPSARAGEGGGGDTGCLPTSCAVGGASPADLPLAHLRPDDPGAGAGVGELSVASLARLHGEVAARLPEAPALERREDEEGTVTREVRVGGGGSAFRGEGVDNSAPGTGVAATMVFVRDLEGGKIFSVEPLVGGRWMPLEGANIVEVAGEIRESLAGPGPGRDGRWFVTAWQKGRYRSEEPAPPAYLEPGRMEGGILGRVSLPLRGGWEVKVDGGGEGVRYDPEDWQVLDRRGVNGALGLGWRGVSRFAGMTVRGSHHAFPNSAGAGESRRDGRVGVEVEGGVEGRRILRLSAGGVWNESRLDAYDFRMVRAALLFSTPLGCGSVHGYGALTFQEYLNPGPPDARVAPSDQDSGSVLSLQYTRPLAGNRVLLIRAGWSRSETGFRDDFYQRFQVGAHLAFRGR